MKQHDFEKSLGVKLGRLREEKGLSQGDVAKALDLPRREVVTDWENANRHIKAADLLTLADFYGVSVDYLLGVSDVKKVNSDIKGICDYTGLSEEAVEALNKLKKRDGKLNALIQFVNYLLSEKSEVLDVMLVNYLLSEIAVRTATSKINDYSDRELSEFLPEITREELLEASETGVYNGKISPFVYLEYYKSHIRTTFHAILESFIYQVEELEWHTQD